MKRCKKFVLEAESGIIFEVSTEKNGEVVIRAKKNNTPNVYSENYTNPPIPEGYKYLEGEWNDGFVIEKVSDKSQFIWIPVGFLNPDGTLDGEHFTEKFGKRNYTNDIFSEYEFDEQLEGELLEQLESVKKYGGFYISRYNISRDREGKPHSKKSCTSWTSITWYEAKNAAESMEQKDSIKSHLIYGAEYDSVLAFFEKLGKKPIRCDSFETLPEWTQENNNGYFKVVREEDKNKRYRRCKAPKVHI